jgi:hypothetical protein
METLRFGFGESVVFAALAALSFIPAARVCEIRDGTLFAIWYVTLAAAIYVVLLGVRGAHSLAAVGIVLLAGAASSLASTVAPAAFALTAALGVARGRFVFPRRFERPGRIELGLAALAIAVVVLTVSRSYAGVSLAIWAFFLAESLYFLLPLEREEPAARNDAGSERDPGNSMDGAAEGEEELGGSG